MVSEPTPPCAHSGWSQALLSRSQQILSMRERWPKPTRPSSSLPLRCHAWHACSQPPAAQCAIPHGPLQVQHAGKTWVVWRRYRQFAAVRGTIAAQSAPASHQLPPKRLAWHATSRQIAAERRTALEGWLHEVILDPAALAHPAFLDFIGFPGPADPGPGDSVADGLAAATSEPAWAERRHDERSSPAVNHAPSPAAWPHPPTNLAPSVLRAATTATMSTSPDALPPAASPPAMTSPAAPSPAASSPATLPATPGQTSDPGGPGAAPDSPSTGPHSPSCASHNNGWCTPPPPPPQSHPSQPDTPATDAGEDEIERQQYASVDSASTSAAAPANGTAEGVAAEGVAAESVATENGAASGDVAAAGLSPLAAASPAAESPAPAGSLRVWLESVKPGYQRFAAAFEVGLRKQPHALYQLQRLATLSHAQPPRPTATPSRHTQPHPAATRRNPTTPSHTQPRQATPSHTQPHLAKTRRNPTTPSHTQTRPSHTNRQYE